MPAKRSDIPPYPDLISPVLKAVDALGGSSQGPQIIPKVISDIGATDDLVAITYDNRPSSILIERIQWARSYAKFGGALESPQRGLFLLTTYGKELLALPEAEGIAAVKEMNKLVRASRAKAKAGGKGSGEADEEDTGAPDADTEDTEWTDVLLNWLHQLTPERFEELVMYMLRSFGLELSRVGGTGDQGIDGMGVAPISPVLSSRVAAQAKRHDPASAIGRDVVALFQRDAAAAGAERAVFVTLGRYSEPARQAAISTTPLWISLTVRSCVSLSARGRSASGSFPKFRRDGSTVSTLDRVAGRRPASAVTVL